MGSSHVASSSAGVPRRCLRAVDYNPPYFLPHVARLLPPTLLPVLPSTRFNLPLPSPPPLLQHTMALQHPLAGLLSRAAAAATVTAVAASVGQSGSGSGPKDYSPPGFDPMEAVNFHPLEIAVTCFVTLIVLLVGAVVFYVWWHRNWTPFKAKQINLIIAMYIGTLLFSYGSLFANRVLPIPPDFGGCVYVIYWMQLYFGMFLMLGAFMVRIWRLYLIFLRRKSISMFTLYLPFGLVMLAGFITGVIISALHLMDPVNFGGINLCYINDLAFYPLFGVILVVLVALAVISFRTRKISHRYFGEYKTLVIQMGLVFLVFFAGLIFVIFGAQYHLWGRVVLAILSPSLMMLTNLVQYANVVYHHMTGRDAYLEKFHTSLRPTAASSSGAGTSFSTSNTSLVPTAPLAGGTVESQSSSALAPAEDTPATERLPRQSTSSLMDTTASGSDLFLTHSSSGTSGGSPDVGPADKEDCHGGHRPSGPSDGDVAMVKDTATAGPAAPVPGGHRPLSILPTRIADDTEADEGFEMGPIGGAGASTTSPSASSNTSRRTDDPEADMFLAEIPRSPLPPQPQGGYVSQPEGLSTFSLAEGAWQPLPAPPSSSGSSLPLPSADSPLSPPHE
ncbi:hypothetical protein H696_03733 [Fonticula alba]|uniref:G-protein coupled receptors family 3 profile domain-containing protein n=1 Tax=Fonticula alba TaxID=691883 RepID=A0A058Z4T5_FONAL|nr:hypothetical protein H696_03733 [Fonticula alba]KCV69299.1 hypothetical protein H696_03733 [Fonticula alba]|eukprot:XP_009495864.1 hypothetical protein H696_03733 [Fonticula alba]